MRVRRHSRAKRCKVVGRIDHDHVGRGLAGSLVGLDRALRPDGLARETDTEGSRVQQLGRSPPYGSQLKTLEQLTGGISIPSSALQSQRVEVELDISHETRQLIEVSKDAVEISIALE